MHNVDLHGIETEYITTGGEFYVGVVNDQIVATGALKQLASDTAEIKRMRIHPDFQRRGLGSAIILALERRAKELGYTTVKLETTLHQTAARKIYMRNGYVEMGRKTDEDFQVLMFEKRRNLG